MRARERDLLFLQKKHLEDNYIYPVPKEVSDLWNAPSDGGSHWMYSGFEHYYFEETHHCWPWSIEKIITRTTAWKGWITKWVGK